MELRLEITNAYEDDTEICLINLTADVPMPGDDLEAWAEDNLFPLTGTGRETGRAVYTVEIVGCKQDPTLVGRKFEWCDL